MYDLIDSTTVLLCYNSTNPRYSLDNTKDFNNFKLCILILIICNINVY